MKKKNKKNQIRMRFSTLLLCILAILLCTAPRACGQYFSLYYDEVGEYDVTVDEINTARDDAGLEENGVLDWLDVGAGATVNLYTDVSQYVYVYPGGILNIYSGNVDWYIAISPQEPYAVVTVYGTDFEVSNGTIQPDGNWTPDPLVGRGTLTGDYGDGSSINLWVWSNIAINLKPPPTEEIQIDIKPGGNPNNINLKSKGVVPVAVLTTGDFDASDVDPTSVVFAGASPVRWRLCDVDDDGDLDMLYHFKTQELKGLDEDSTEATLTGETNSGDVIAGTDTVRIVPTKK